MNALKQELNFFLPIEIMLYIISFLEIKDVLLLSRVNTTFYHLVNDDHFWKEKFQKIAGDIQVNNDTYKNAFKNIYNGQKKYQLAKEFVAKCKLDDLETLENFTVQTFLNHFVSQQTALSWTNEIESLVYAATLLYKHTIEQCFADRSKNNGVSSHSQNRQNKIFCRINDFLNTLRMRRFQIFKAPSDLEYLQDLKNYINKTPGVFKSEELEELLVGKIEKAQKRLLPKTSSIDMLFDAIPNLPDSPRLR